MPVDDITLEAEEKMEKAVEAFRHELRTVHTGRASPALVEGLRVNYYGSLTPLNQLATVSAPQPQLILIRPFDPSSVKEIEKAVLTSSLGVTPSTDGKVVRVPIPPLSEERRHQLQQSIKQLAEEAKVAIRNTRREANKALDAEKKQGTITEDDLYRAKDGILELTHEYEARVEEAFEKKSQEVMEV